MQAIIDFATARPVDAFQMVCVALAFLTAIAGAVAWYLDETKYDRRRNARDKRQHKARAARMAAYRRRAAI